MNLPLKGVIPPVVTPLLENSNLDSKGLKNLIEHLLCGGVHGIFLLGTNGEGPSLGQDLRKQVITEACNIVNGRVPVLVGITDTAFEATLSIAEHSKNAGADALVVAPPYYLPISQKEVCHYLKSLAPKLPLPFLLYNMPSCTKLHLSIETIRKAKELGAIGVKDSSGDLAFFYTLLEEFRCTPDFSIMAGAELFLSEAILNGGHGVVAGGANIFPALFVDFYEAAIAKDMDRVAELRQKVLIIHRTIYSVGDTPTRSIRAIKCALSILGICEDHMAQPLYKMNAEERLKVKNHLNNLEYKKDSNPII